MNSKIIAAVVISALILIPSYSIRGEISDRNEVRTAGGAGVPEGDLPPSE